MLAGEKGVMGVEGLVLPPDARLSLRLVPMGDLALEAPESKLAWEREGCTGGFASPPLVFFLENRPIVAVFHWVSILVRAFPRFVGFTADSQVLLANRELWRKRRSAQ